LTSIYYYIIFSTFVSIHFDLIRHFFCFVVVHQNDLCKYCVVLFLIISDFYRPQKIKNSLETGLGSQDLYGSVENK
jgi:hypothetical protein